MRLQHLRRNAVAYLALLVAVTTGSAYAAEKVAAGSVTTKALAKNAVTSPKIKKNAVRSTDLKNGTVRAADLAPGLLPRDAEVYVETFGVPTPVPNPDGFFEPDEDDGDLDIPATFGGGRVVLRFFSTSAFVDCSAGVGHAGMYVDGQPVPATKRFMPGTGAGAEPVELLAVVDLGAGAHDVAYGFDCPNGTVSVYGLDAPSFTASVLAR
jgi:hypothetical protein